MIVSNTEEYFNYVTINLFGITKGPSFILKQGYTGEAEHKGMIYYNVDNIIGDYMLTDNFEINYENVNGHKFISYDDDFSEINRCC